MSVVLCLCLNVSRKDGRVTSFSGRVPRQEALTCRDFLHVLSAQSPQLCRLCPTSRGIRDIILQSGEIWCHVHFSPCQRRLTSEVAERLLSEPRVCSVRTLDLSHCSSLMPRTLHVLLHRSMLFCLLEKGNIGSTWFRGEPFRIHLGQP